LIEAPVLGVADLLTGGAGLDLEVRSGDLEIVVLITKDRELAGSLVPTARLLQCLRDGVRFVATVTHTDDGRIDLEVTAAP